MSQMIGSYNLLDCFPKTMVNEVPIHSYMILPNVSLVGCCAV